MEPLLTIRSFPIKLRFESKKAQLNIQSFRPKLRIVRNVNGLRIRTQPAKVLISNKGLKKSVMSMKPSLMLMKEYAEQGMRAALQAVGEIAENGSAMAEHNVSIADIAAQRFIPMIETALAFIPAEGPEITVSDHKLDISYTPDELQFIWEIQRPKIEYKPYELKVHVVSYPKVVIEYTGRHGALPKKAKASRFEART